MPAAARRAAWSRAWRGWMDDMSTTTLPWRRPPSVPWWNNTSSTTSPLSSRVITKSACATASAGVSHTRAPKSCRRSALLRERFQTLTVQPASHRRRAMGNPIMPMPSTATCRALVGAVEEVVVFTCMAKKWRFPATPGTARKWLNQTGCRGPRSWGWRAAACGRRAMKGCLHGRQTAHRGGCWRGHCAAA